MRRRTVLKLVGGATGIDPPGMRTAGPVRGEDPASGPSTSRHPDRETGRRELSSHSVSVREVARRMDHAEPAKRLWGNGPPTNDRPNASSGDKVTFHGTEYVHYPDEADRTAYDLGMINRIATGRSDDVVGLTSLGEKGLFECHRFQDPASAGTTGSGTGRHLRSVVDRHLDGTTHRCLWLNTRLTATAANRAYRRKKIGEVVGASGYDLVGFGEGYFDYQAKDLRDAYKSAHTGSGPYDHEYGPSTKFKGKFCCGLQTVVAKDGGKRWLNGGETRKDTYAESGTFDPSDAAEGYQRVQVGVDVDGVSDAAFDLYITHLDAYDWNRDRKNRKQQLDILTDRIEQRQDDRGSVPKVVFGDLNVHSSNNHTSGTVKAHQATITEDDLLDYKMLLQEMSKVGMQSAKLTHGGPAMGANYCSVVDETPGTGRCTATCHCDPFDASGVPGNWIDYVFVEKPRERHDIKLDVSRIWEVPMHVENCSCLSDRVAKSTPNATVKPEHGKQRPFLTDHPGLGLDIVTAPN